MGLLRGASRGRAKEASAPLAKSLGNFNPEMQAFKGVLILT